MVCGGELELSTAERDIATDWIAAYKKYFHTDRLLSLHWRLDSSSDFLELTPSRVKRSDAAKVILLFRFLLKDSGIRRKLCAHRAA